MKTIRGKLLVYFLVFVMMFECMAIFIFVGSNKLTDTYQSSIKRFLILNHISHYTNLVTDDVKAFATDHNVKVKTNYYQDKKRLVDATDKFSRELDVQGHSDLEDYHHLLETFLHESDLTVGFVILNDVEKYTFHLEETQHTADYIQETTLDLIDTELTTYQPIFRQLKKRNDSFFIFSIFLFLTMSLLAIFFAYLFSKGITTPLNRLSASAREVAKGKFDGPPVTITSKDELKLLGDTFDGMRRNISQLVQEIQDQSELDRLLKEMELKQLQNQVNPHFLFNTLNTLSKMAYLEDAHTTSNLIDSMATMLRHSLKNIDEPATLRDEVNVVKDYFRIQKTRFSERISFELLVDETCLDIKIPRLTLQPLVENAFIHGIEEKEEGGIIRVHVERDNHDHVLVSVMDDGVGMTDEQQRKIMSPTKPNQHTGHSTGIGLINVIRRLQLFYQKDNIVTITSGVNQGTVVQLLLPNLTIVK